MADALDPQARALLERAAASGAPPPHALTPEEARAAYEAGTPALAGPGEPVAEVADLTVPGVAGPVPIRLYRPVVGPAPAVLWLHGGGFVVGSLDSHDALCRRLANRLGAVVVAVDYRLAPEHPFPAAVEDARSALEWMLGHASELGIDARRVAVGGDSAGGTLAATLARHVPGLALQVLVYPVTDCRFDRPSYQRNGSGYHLSTETMRWYWDQYAPGPERRHPDASPMRADQLAGVAPALVLVAGFDPLRDEGLAYAERLRSAGVAVEVREAPGQIHGYLRWLAATGRAAGEAIETIAAALARAWA